MLGFEFRSVWHYSHDFPSTMMSARQSLQWSNWFKTWWIGIILEFAFIFLLGCNHIWQFNVINMVLTITSINIWVYKCWVFTSTWTVPTFGTEIFEKWTLKWKQKSGSRSFSFRPRVSNSWTLNHIGPQTCLYWPVRWKPCFKRQRY